MSLSWKSIPAQLCGILVALLWAVADVSASPYSVYAVRLDRWMPRNPATPVFGTDYTTAGLKLGTPPESAVAATPGGDCLPLPAETPCAASWGTGPPGHGNSRSGSLLVMGASTSRPPVWVPASAAVNVNSSFVVPSTYHLPGYPVATRYYSYHNVLGIFYPSHSNAPTAPLTVYAATTTTRSGGNYDSSRGGYIRITPGANRFGGTMRFFFGAGYYYKGQAERPSPGSYAYYRWNAIRTQSNAGTGTGGAFGPNPPMRNTMMGPQTQGQTATYGSTYLKHSTLQTTLGAFLTYQFWGFSTIVPWTTGRVTVHQSLGPFTTATHIVATGYDTRAVTSGGGLTGKLSLVQPFLYHNYSAAGTPGASTHLAFMRRLTLTFLPEPGAALLLSAGLVGIGVLYRARSR